MYKRKIRKVRQSMGQLMNQILSRENMKWHTKKVKANKGPEAL
ncbi:hypothetical protein HMPREF9998_00943, partial [Peptostreptococcus anaerobius VPI 4330 = DSM 2949]